MECYLRIEGVNLDTVLSDTPHISVERGSSFLLRQLTRDLPTLIKDKGVFDIDLESISVGASIGLYQFKTNDPEAIKILPAKIRDFLNHHEDYKYFTFVIDAVAASGENNFLSDLDALKKANRYQQMQMPSFSLADIAIEAKDPCACNGILPAKEKLKAGTMKGDVSPSVKKRFKQGKDLRQGFYQREAGEEFKEENGFRFTDRLDQLSADPSIRNNLNNKVAVIYFDGNKFGKLKKDHCKTKAAQQEFDKAMQGFHSGYLANFLKDIKGNPDYLYKDKEDKEKLLLRLEVLMWGGDEILLVVPAWCGMHALNFFYEQSKDWSFKGERLTYSGGVVFANHKTPIQRLKALAKDLAEEVKTASAGETYDGFDYLILESLNCPTTSLATVRKQVFGEQVAKTRSLLAPISLTDLESSDSLKVMAKSQLHKIAHAIIEEGLQSEDAAEQLGNKAKKSIERMQQVARLSEDALNDAKQHMTRLFKPFNKLPVSQEHIWPWLHTAELWDYLPPIDRDETEEKEVI